MSTTASGLGNGVPDSSTDVVPASALVWRTPWRAGRPILAVEGAAWTGVRMGEWALRSGWFADVHPHEEVTHVLEGSLRICIGDEVHTLAAGDTLLVPGGTAARYEAPVFARMLFIYGPNPQGLRTPPPTEGAFDGE